MVRRRDGIVGTRHGPTRSQCPSIKVHFIDPVLSFLCVVLRKAVFSKYFNLTQLRTAFKDFLGTFYGKQI